MVSKVLIVGFLFWLTWAGTETPVPADQSAAPAVPWKADSFPGNPFNLPQAAQSAISSRVGRDYFRYRTRKTKQGARADNPPQSLTAAFRSDNVQIVSASFTWALQLRSYGRGTSLHRARPTLPIASENRVDYKRGALREWYINGPLGLEQGFTLTERPPDDGQPLTICLVAKGSLKPMLDLSHNGLYLADDHGKTRLRYSGLSAVDASGKKLPAWLAMQHSHVLLQVNDRGARYPLTIDPFIQSAELSAEDGQAFDDFGFSVAASANTVVFNSTSTGGAAYVFVEPAAGWTTTSRFAAKLTASGAQFNQVAISGNTVVAAGRSGSLYVFVEPASGWTTTSSPTAVLTASDQERLLRVAISGNTVVAGAPSANGRNLQQGAAYVFVKPTNGWINMTETARLTASDGLTNDRFGVAVSVSVDTVLVGAPCATVATHPLQGAAYVYVRPADGWANMVQTAKLTASSAQRGENFGSSVALSGTTAVIGASQADSVKGPGAAYVFIRPASGWATTATYTAKLTTSGGTRWAYFGWSVAVDTNVIVVAARNATVGTNRAQGAAYVFVEPASGWATTSTCTAQLTAADGVAGDAFGYSVAIIGSTVFIGAPYHKLASTAQGIGYVF